MTCGTPTLNSHQALRENLGPTKDCLSDDEVWSQPSELLDEDKKILGERPVSSDSLLKIDVYPITLPLCNLRSKLFGLCSSSECVFPRGDVLAVGVSSNRIDNFGPLSKLPASPRIFE